MNESENDIVVSGVSGRYPKAENVEQLWDLLLNGVNLSSPECVWPTKGKLALPIARGQLTCLDKYDHQFFNQSEEEANLYDPQLRLFAETTYEAIYDAGINPETLRDSKTGVYIGTCYNDTENAIRTKHFDADPIFQLTASRMSSIFGFKGPCTIIDTACASSLSCVNEAYLAMKRGLAESMVVGGLAIHLSLFTPFAFRALRMISYDGASKCLDKDVDGYCRSESVVSLFLQKRKNAKRIYATLLYSKTNTDGYKEEGITFPKYDTQKTLMENALKEANIDPLSINYVEAHMTGTAAGDVVESRSITDVYRQNSTKPIKFGCIKSNLGHTEGASGCVAITKVCKVFQNCLIPPNIHYRVPNPNIEPLINGVIEQVLKPTPFHDDIIPVNSFGFGGVNIHAIFKGNEKRMNKNSFNFAPNYPRLITFSGRTVDSVENAFHWIQHNKEKITNEFLALVSDVSVIEPTSGFNGRGFLVMDKDSTLTVETTEIYEKSPICLLFPGIDLTKNQCIHQLMKMKPFSKAIDECDEILKSVSFDLKSVLSDKESKYKNIIEALVCTVSVQMATYETLNYIGIEADAYFGESIGEICAAFADKCITKYEALWITFYIAKTLHEQNNDGVMIAANLQLNDKIAHRYTNTQIIGCDLQRNTILSTSSDNLSELTQNLRNEKVSFNVLETCGKVFHNSNFEFVELLSKKLQNILNNNTVCHSKWIKKDSKSDLWNYFSKLMFDKLEANSAEKSTMSTLEMKSFIFSSNSSIQLKTKSKLSNVETGSIHRLLNAIGKIYECGHNVAIEKLYPNVEYPVSRETASLSQLMQWNHSKKLTVFKYPDYFVLDKSQKKLTVDLADPVYKFVDGHYIDGRLLFPATGYLYLIAYTCMGYGEEIVTKSFEFKNVKFRRATLVPKVGAVSFTCTINRSTGEFEISEGGSTCSSGYVRLIGDDRIDHMMHEQIDMVDEKIESDSSITLKGMEIYKELRIRGYDYGPNFQCLEEVQSDGSSGKIKWNGHWVNFVDSVLQLSLFEQKQKILYIPTSIDYLLFNATKFQKLLQTDELSNSFTFDSVNVNRNINVGDGAMIIRNILGAATNRRVPEQRVLTNAETFVPYNEVIISETKTEWNDYSQLCSKIIEKLSKSDFEFDNLEQIKEIMDSSEKYTLLKMLVEAIENKKNVSMFDELIAAHKNSLDNDFNANNMEDTLFEQQIDVIIENNDTRDIQILEVNSTQHVLLPAVMDRIHDNQMTCSNALIHPTATSTSMPFVQQFTEWDAKKEHVISAAHKDIDLVIFKDWSTSLMKFEDNSEFDVDLKSFLKSAHDSLKDNGFLVAIFRQNTSPVEQTLLSTRGIKTPKFRSLSEIRGVVNESDFSLISEKVDNFSNVCILLRKVTRKQNSQEPIVVKIETNAYEWVEKLKESLNQKERKVWLLANDSDISGIIGFVRCLRKEAKGSIVRCLFGVGAQLTQKMIENDLVMNVIRNNELGSFRHTKIDAMNIKKSSNGIVLDIETKGDLSSLKWFQSDDTNTKKDTNEIDIYYASLNFKDVMVAAGKVPLNAYPSDYQTANPIGMEFSGIDSNNNRVCGFNVGGSIGSKISNGYIFPVPDSWTLEEAATIPVVYTTVYYALILRGRLMNGESILIHAGSGGVGQAAISVCLRMNCNIFVTVGSEEKRKFLMEQFPELNPSRIGNSRNLTFEELIMKETDGKGVDVILNSLAEEKQNASIRCLAKYGRFLEIGKYDLIINSPLDPSDFERNQTFHVICVAHLTAAFYSGDSSAQKLFCEFDSLLRRGMATGEVRPLKRTVFEKHQCEEAFRYMANGKHIGKVLIKIRDEKQHKNELLMQVTPKTFFSHEKSYVISGGLGGFGLEVAHWMVLRGARKLILTSRSGFKDNYQQFSVKRIENEGAEVQVVVNDCTTVEKTRDLMKRAVEMGTVGGIFNLNLVLRDAPFDEQTVEAFDEVCSSKVKTTLNFDKISREMCPKLDYFVCFSSIASMMGNTSQTNYGFANSVMERICEKRRKEGLHGLAVQWGSIGDVGFIAENFANADGLLRSSIIAQRMPSCLHTFDRLLHSPYPIVSSYIRAARRSTTGSKDDILKQICHVLGVKDPEKLDPNTTLNELGMDSLMAVEIKQGLEREYDTILSTQEIRSLTVKELKEIEKKKTSTKSEQKTGTDKLSFNKSYLEMPTDIFTPLNGFDQGIPIFFFPPVEGNFNLMSTIAQFINRPVIGVNWTQEINSLSSVKEVAEKYVEIIKEQYKLPGYDFVGYSFGAAIALETSIQMQVSINDYVVKKLIVLDGSPDFLKNQMDDTFQEKNNKMVTERFMDYICTKIKLENLEIMKLREELLELNSKEKKAVKLAELISAKLSEKCEPALLLASIDRMSKKLKMATEMVMDRKFRGILSLIRAKEVARSLPLQIISNDYGLSEHVDGKVNVIVKPGHHESFITMNAEEISRFIEDEFRIEFY